VDEATITVEAQQLAFGRSEGSGRAVVFVHGNSSSSRTWRQLLAGPFGQRYRCLALDLPGHGRSAPASDHAAYSLPGYAAALTGFCRALDAADAVIVGWSLGGHIAIEAAPHLPDAAGFLVYGTPPVATAAQMPEAFLPNPVLNVGFTAEISRDDAEAYASSFVAPGSALNTDDAVTDILRTDGAARASLFASVGEGRFADEVAIVATLGRPLAVLHGEKEQLISLDYLTKLSIPSLWRGAVQIVPGTGHAPHLEAPEEFTRLLEQFIADVG
jgi:pimeloyl-ACP methyl ester carboxylesterase